MILAFDPFRPDEVLCFDRDAYPSAIPRRFFGVWMPLENWRDHQPEETWPALGGFDEWLARMAFRQLDMKGRQAHSVQRAIQRGETSKAELDAFRCNPHL